ncbi:response regulator transcription factor [Chloroflexota bacterium]
MAEKILIVEDEPTLVETLTYNLKRAGYTVNSISDGHAAIKAARDNQPDLIVLDIMLPGIDGFEITRILRQEMTIPILMLTARDEEIDRVIGLEIGADDYITKPFSMRELIERIKALLRRVRIDMEKATEIPRPDENKININNLTINLTRLEVLLDDKVISLKPKEYELLLYLTRHRGQVMSRDNIVEHVWGWDFSGGSRTVDVHVRWLRKKIEEDPANPIRIVTIRGVGYRFEG